ncbi:isocitrate lyase/phosphoenolpyruvate mutase family protein [uncultured Pseudoteredinibacter sp.]|uniref:isocitrate lyase/PEP mutase family protein n=1 Tax=uncultured Pseudoteredinibacter sp. TaxID=1641701 RepID=UPI0026239D51|nr:isocitrate lyase/phosphoenolpyruvate mutase family protein [uncultured Pseudoteredinibacter sp.]
MNIEKALKFREMHGRADGIVLLNVWDAASAAIVQAQGAEAIATSSASLAWANGYPDGNAMPVEVLVAAVGNISRVCRVPLTVDIEAGYSDSEGDILQLLEGLLSLGVVGINIEDGQSEPEVLERKIQAIRNHFGSERLFINARSDVYLNGLHPKDSCFTELKRRLEIYSQAGADGLFVPGLLDLALINELSRELTLPLNVMLSSSETKQADYIEAGVKRISYGPASFLAVYEGLGKFSRRQTSESELDYTAMNALMSERGQTL